VRHRRGDEEDELAPRDGRLEGVGVVRVRLEQPQPLRGAGETPQQRGLAPVPEVTQGCVDDAASAEELPHEPGADVAGGSGDAAHPAAHLSRSMLLPRLPSLGIIPAFCVETVASSALSHSELAS